MVEDCHPQFTVLYFSNPHDVVAPTRVDEQAVLAWQRQVAKKYGRLYATFGNAQDAHTGTKQCYPQLDSSSNYCGFATGQPCRRMKVTAAPRLLMPSSENR
jgi:hypothetical protein